MQGGVVVKVFLPGGQERMRGTDTCWGALRGVANLACSRVGNFEIILTFDAKSNVLQSG